MNVGHGKYLFKATFQTQFYSAGSVSAALAVLVRFIIEEQGMELTFRLLGIEKIICFLVLVPDFT